MQDDGATRSERYAVLDGMRGAAALVVITDHVPSALLQGWLPGRYLAVDFFFALSGFVLAHVYAPRLAEGWSFARFMRARLMRLYPLYLFATLIGAALAFAYIWKGWIAASWGQGLASTAFGALYLPTPPPLSVHANEPYPFNGPAWSLFFELVVNIVFALIATRLRWRGLIAILLLNAAMLVWTAAVFGKLDSGFQWSNFLGGFPRVGYAFFAGVAVYRLRALWRAPAIPAWLAFAALLGVFMVPASGGWRPIWDVGAATLMFPLLVMFAANARAGGAFRSVCVGAGALSYGFYVLQAPVRDWTSILLSLYAPHLSLPGLAQVALVAGLTVAAAALLHVAYDAPLRRWLARRMPARPLPLDAATS
ncbi:MAG TPA: acyltransferase [Caulobacterales bacterium]|nr:acyltransferase [Caulobacterales bacterium]